jgi:hypothetical protein
VASILLGHAQQSLNGLLVCMGVSKHSSEATTGALTVSVALNLNDHLLQTPDGLLATLLGNLFG